MCFSTTDFLRYAIQNLRCVLSANERMRPCHTYFAIVPYLNNFRKRGGGRLPNEGRYGCASSAKSRLNKISSKKPDARAQKEPKSLITGKGLRNFKAQNHNISANTPHFVYSFIKCDPEKTIRRLNLRLNLYL